MLYNSPKSVLDSIAKLIADDREQFSKERDALESKLQVEAMKKMKYEYDVPEGIEKEGVAHFIGAASAAHKAGQKKFSFGGKTYPVKIKPHVAHKVNEQQIKEEDDDNVTANVAGHKVTLHRGSSTDDSSTYTLHHSSGAKKVTIGDKHRDENGEVSGEKVNKAFGLESKHKLGHKIAGSMNGMGGISKFQESVEMEENTDTPGNSAHQCAVHVKHEQFGEGKTLFSQHAEPSEDGTIAWYDVMFEHGIEKQVKTSDLNILVSESHGNHKKKMKEEVDLEEGRGRPRKNPVAAKKKDDDEDDYGPDTGPEPDQNIVNHLKKSVDTSGTHDVKFADGSTHKVPSHVAHKVLGAMGKLKPADRLEIQKHINASHKNLMDVHRMIK